MDKDFKWCFCGLVGLPQYLGKCKRHAKSEPPKKLEKQRAFRGNSKWQVEQQMFNNKGE